jgi:hypothetical protein
MKYAAIIEFVLWRHGRDLSGPLHHVAGYTETRHGPPALFGDFVTACGLTLPRQGAYFSTESIRSSPSSCGDCFA